MALVILLGSSLGYLGLGAQPPTAEWGVLIADGKNFMTTAWWMSIFPGMAIVLTGLGFSLLGDGIASGWGGGHDRAVLSVRDLTVRIGSSAARAGGSASMSMPAKCSASSASPARARA